jgi:membrane AbrB-like protein
MSPLGFLNDTYRYGEGLMRVELWSGLVLLTIGAVGGLGARWVGIPAGMIVGAMFASGIYKLSGGKFGPWERRYGLFGRLVLGAAVGASFTMEVIPSLKAVLLPSLVLVAVVIGTGLGLGWLLSRLTQLNIATALISCVPGGLPAMVAMAEEMDADATVVAAIHFSRLVTVLLAVPAVVRLLPVGTATGVGSTPVEGTAGLGLTLFILILGLACGLLGLRLGIPAGDLLAPIIIIGGGNLLGAGWGPIHGGFMDVAMVFIGIAAGAQISRESLGRLRQVALSAVVVVGSLVTIGLAAGWVLSWIASLDPVTGLMSGAPGGASTMPAIAHEMGGDMRLVAAVHMVRMLTAFVCLPTMLQLLLRRGGHDQVVKVQGSEER